MNSEALRLQLIKEYHDACDEEMFSQATVAALRKCSLATVERERWAGTGIPFRKFGHAVRYYKSDIRRWLKNHPPLHSTTYAKHLKKIQQENKNV